MTANIEWFYTRGGDCKICQDLRTSHHEDCPVRLIDSMIVEVVWKGETPSWSEEQRTGSFQGKVKDEVIRQVAAHAVSNGVSEVTARTRYVIPGEDVSFEVQQNIREIEGFHKAKEEERLRLASLRYDREARDHLIQELESQRHEFVPEAYERRMTAILARFQHLKD